MAHTGMTAVAKQVETLFDAGSMAELTDAQLLERFNARRDARGEAAFGELVARHGPMVLSVCRQILNDPHLAEDAFQATFLVLARKGRAVLRSGWLGGWLHAVAVRTARCARGRRARRLRREEIGTMDSVGFEAAAGPNTRSPDQILIAGDLANVLHGEIARLPEAFRLPVVLCYLEGLTVHETASRLKVSHGTVRSRMARAREKLRQGLSRRGVVAPAAVLAALLDAGPASAAVSTSLATVTTRAAAQFAMTASGNGLVSATTVSLAHRIVRSMLVHKLLLAGVAVPLLGTVAGGAALVAVALTGRSDRAKSPEVPPLLTISAGPIGQAAPVAVALDSAKPTTPTARTVRIQVLDPDGRPARNVRVHVSIWTDEKDFKHNRDYPTDDTGAALVELPGTYRIVRLFISKPPLVAMFVHWEENELKAGKRIPDEYTIQLERGTAAGGRIVDENGKPIAGARVQVRLENGVRPAQGDPQTGYDPGLAEGDDAAITGAEGRWHIDNVPRNAKVELSLLVTHPDYASDEIWGETQHTAAITAAKLLERSATLKLKSGTVIRGRVTDELGKPITDAIIVRGDRPYFASTPSEFLTDADGRYRLPTQRSGKVMITVIAPGWAPQDRSVDVRPGLASQDFRMARGRPVALSFVDTAGKPIPQADVNVRSWNNHEALHNVDLRKVHDTKIPRRPNSNGVWEWTWAPETPVALEVRAAGFASQHLEVTGGAPQRTIVLKPEHRVLGRVTDARSGRPITAFSVIPVNVFRTDFLSAEPGNAQSGKGGRLDYLATRADIPIRLRIEAMGYRAQDGPDFRIGDDDARTQDFRLEPSPPITGRIVDAAGRPAIGVKVAVATPTQHASPWSDRHSQTFPADSAGRFSIPDPREPWALVVRSETGFVLGEFADGRKDVGTLTLRPFATIRGHFRDGGRPVQGATVMLKVLRLRGDTRAWLDNGAAGRVTGPDGQFEFTDVPPMPLDLSVYLGPWKDEPFRSGPSVPLNVEPGQRIELELGSNGATVAGKVALKGLVPPDLDCTYSLNHLIRREHAIAPPSGVAELGFDVRKGWRDAWLDGAEGETYLRTLPHWFVKLAPDGAFRISGVPTGQYDLSVRVYAKPTGCLVEPLARVVMPVTVTADDVKRGTVTLPEMTATVVPIPATGDKPQLPFTRPDGTNGSLVEFRGSYTLVHFWASWCGPCKAQFPALRRLHDRFAARGLSVLGLSVDENPNAWRDATKYLAAPWPQGRVSSGAETGVSSVPAYWLIDREGRILRKASHPDELVEPLSSRLK
jgi:RNA polymerase sigma factor (sigma-70 family)